MLKVLLRNTEVSRETPVPGDLTRVKGVRYSGGWDPGHGSTTVKTSLTDPQTPGSDVGGSQYATRGRSAGSGRGEGHRRLGGRGVGSVGRSQM